MSTNFSISENLEKGSLFVNEQSGWKTRNSDIYYFYSCDSKNKKYIKPNENGGYFLHEIFCKLVHNFLTNTLQAFNGEIQMIVKKHVYRSSNKKQLPCSITQLH